MGSPKGAIARIALWAEIARRMALGQNQKEIAKAVSLQHTTINRTVHHPAYIEYLNKAIADRDKQIYDVRGHFVDHLEKACKTITDTLEFSPDEELRFRAAKETLRLSEGKQDSYGVHTTINGNIQVANLTFEDALEQNPLRPNYEQLKLDVPSSAEAFLSFEDDNDYVDVEDDDDNTSVDSTDDLDDFVPDEWVGGSTLDVIKEDLLNVEQ